MSRIVTAEELNRMEHGTVVEAFSGIVKKVGRAEAKRNQHGEYLFQFITLESGGRQVEVMMSGCEEVREADAGKHVTFLSSSTKRGLSGVFCDIYKNKTKLKVNGAAIVQFGAGRWGEAQEASQNRQAQPPAARQDHSMTRQAPAQAPSGETFQVPGLYFGAPLTDRKVKAAAFKMARLWLVCAESAEWLIQQAMRFPTVAESVDGQDLATTLFIECNRKGYADLVPPPEQVAKAAQADDVDRAAEQQRIAEEEQRKKDDEERRRRDKEAQRDKEVDDVPF